MADDREELERITDVPFADDIETERPGRFRLWLSNLLRRTIAYLYGWDGTEWKRLQLYTVVGTKALPVAIYGAGGFKHGIYVNSTGSVGCFPHHQDYVSASTSAWAFQNVASLCVSRREERIDAGSAAVVGVTSTPAVLVPANGDRVRVVIRNLGSDNVLISLDSAPSTSNAFRLRPGEDIEIKNPADIWAVDESGAGPNDVGYWEERCST